MSCWQCSFKSRSLLTPCGLMRYSMAVMVYSPLEKHGILIPLAVYIILRSISTLFWCFLMALNPLHLLTLTGRSTIWTCWNSSTLCRPAPPHTQSTVWKDSPSPAICPYQAYLTGRTRSQYGKSYHCDAIGCSHCACPLPGLCTWLGSRRQGFSGITLWLPQGSTQSTPRRTTWEWLGCWIKS